MHLLAMTIGLSAVLISATMIWSSLMSQADLDSLTASVTNITGVAESAVALIGNIATELAAALAAQPEDDGVALEALQAKLDSSATDLAAAITANTPADPSQPAADDGTTNDSASGTNQPDPNATDPAE